MSLVAVVRPDSWNVALLVHVLGAMILVGGLVASAGLLAFARGDVRLLRFGYWSLLALSLPGWILLRIGATLALATLLLAMDVVAVWAMAGKPS